MTFAEYEAQGWRLCAIEPGKKGPVYDGWNTAAMPAETIETLGQGAGLLHSLSGTCAIDIDDISAARAWWAEHGVDIDALCDAPESVHVRSGRAGRDKLLYKLSKPLRTLKPKGSGTELRCATAGGESVQDVLPPSIHPITKRAYFWHYGDELVGDWRSLPNIPANVFRVWRDLVASEPVREVVNEKPQTVQADVLRKAVETFIASRKLDIDAYDDWIEIGMRIHKQTNGASQGLMLWNEISKPGKTYKGLADLKMHWVSFDATGLLGLDAAIREVPATRDDFEDVHEAAPGEVNTEELIEKSKKDLLKAANEFLKARLIYVKELERYFDREDHHLFMTNQGIEHTFAHKVPKKVSVMRLLRDLGADKPIVSRMGFHPGEGVIFTERGDSYANVYRARLPEPLPATAEEREKIEWIFDRIDDVPYREWLIQFYGHVVQHPGVKIKSAPLIWSDTQGNGKTTLVAKIPALLVGAAYSIEMSNDVLAGEFNDELRHAWHINLSEFSGGSRRENDQVTKKVERWIVEDTIDLHQKGLAATTIPNHFFLTASSNKENAASISNTDRKWGIHEMHARAMTEREMAWFFEGFLNTPRAAGVLRHYFLAVDLTGFNPNARAPETAAKAEMARANIAADLEILIELFEQRTGPFAKEVVITGDLRDYIHKHCPNKPSADRIGRLLARAPFNGKPFRFKNNSGIYRAFALYNPARWIGAPGAEIMAHIQGDEISVEDDLLN